MILYTQGGEMWYTAFPPAFLNFEGTFEPVIERGYLQLAAEEGNFLIGRTNIDSQYWNGHLSVIHPDSYNAVIRMMVFIATIVGFLSIPFTISIISYFFSTQMVKPIRALQTN